MRLGLAARSRSPGLQLIEKTTQSTPANATHWSTRTMAREMGISKASVSRIWRASGLKPHRVESFKVSNDPNFADKLEAIVGLYLNPPEHALVLCVDEKSQIQALDRTQPGLPMKKGRGATMTHDYKRNGTTTLFAALNTANGEVFGLCQENHRHQEWLKFLRMIDQTIPANKNIYLICDNYATHKHARVQRWLQTHKRFHVRFTPTSASWLNMIERFFRDLTHNRIRRGVFQDLEQLITAIGDYIDAHNKNPKALHMDCQRQTTSSKRSLALKPRSIKDDLLETLHCDQRPWTIADLTFLQKKSRDHYMMRCTIELTSVLPCGISAGSIGPAR